MKDAANVEKVDAMKRSLFKVENPKEHYTDAGSRQATGKIATLLNCIQN